MAPESEATAARNCDDGQARAGAGAASATDAVSGSIAAHKRPCASERKSMLAERSGAGERRAKRRRVPTASRESLLAELRAHAAFDAREAAMRDRLVAFVAEHAGAFDRALAIGHVTASAWIVDPGRTRALLTHHRKLDKWLQLGGHVDGDPDVRRAALREAREESGLTSLRFVADAIYDIDVHPIPARPGEPAHDHYDVRFALEADPDEPLVVTAESKELAWIPIEALAAYGADESVLRLARKTPSIAG
jgi:8-oxo-dGTP pyrophosphatase MutT (NUDIX family)